MFVDGNKTALYTASFGIAMLLQAFTDPAAAEEARDQAVWI